MAEIMRFSGPANDFAQLLFPGTRTALIQRRVLTYAHHLDINAGDVYNARIVLISCS